MSGSASMMSAVNVITRALFFSPNVNRITSATKINQTLYFSSLFILSAYAALIILPNKKQHQQSYCFIKISKSKMNVALA